MGRREEKHLKKEKESGTRKRQRRRIRLFLVVLLALFGLAVASAIIHYRTYPGIVEIDSLTADEIELDSITLVWDAPRNADTYHVYYCEQKEYQKRQAEVKDKTAERSEKEKEKDTASEVDESTVAKWNEKTVNKNEINVSGLDEGVTYSFVIRADSRDFRGRYTEIKNFTTQQRQKIIADKEMIKLTGSEAFMIDAKADTSMTFESSDPAVIKVDEDTGRAETTGPGTAVITVKAKETDQYAEDSRKISVTVYPAEPVDIEGSEAKIMYHLSSANCETVMRVRGSGGASIPQSFAYTGKRYMVTFGMYGPTRIVRYRKDGSGRKVIKPKVSLGHPNGTTYDPERNMIYVLKGQGSSGFTLYDISNNDYLVGNFDRSCSGIGYDTVRKCLYTSSRSAILQYDPADYTRIKKVGVTQHKEFMSIQDCACYDGILMHCLSTASNRHGFNYIDLYDMRHDKYIGTISCKLSEVESASVNEDGFLEVLSNGRGNANYIWRTDFNIKLLAKEFH